MQPQSLLALHLFLAKQNSCALWQPQEQNSIGDSHTEVGLKAQLSPRAYATKEENLKSLHVQTSN